MHPLLSSMLMTSYRQQMAFESWQGESSFKFSILYRVRQGAVCSLIFFKMYSQEIFATLRNAGLGVHICGSFCGIISYADDNCLIPTTRNLRQKMTQILEKLAIRVNIILKYFLKYKKEATDM